MTATPPLEETIAAILDETTPQGHFIPTRYPFTYAYDFFRTHTKQFLPETPNVFLDRGETSGMVAQYAERLGKPKFDVVIALADAYLEESNIHPSDEAMTYAMEYQRHTAWKACGLDTQGPEPKPLPS